jgi:hypothetical protein
VFDDTQQRQRARGRRRACGCVVEAFDLPDDRVALAVEKALEAVAIERIGQLLDSDMTETSNTSMRIPTALREAAALAAKELKVAPSATALTTMALRATLEAAVMRAALDEHYSQYPEARPDLADIAIAAAEIDGNPLATDPERIRRAAAEIAATHPDPEPEDVLLWAEARAFPS